MNTDNNQVCPVCGDTGYLAVDNRRMPCPEGCPANPVEQKDYNNTYASKNVFIPQSLENKIEVIFSENTLTIKEKRVEQPNDAKQSKDHIGEHTEMVEQPNRPDWADAWEKANKFYQDKGGVNPAAFEIGWKAARSSFKTPQREAAKSALERWQEEREELILSGGEGSKATIKGVLDIEQQGGVEGKPEHCFKTPEGQSYYIKLLEDEVRQLDRQNGEQQQELARLQSENEELKKQIVEEVQNAMRSGKSVFEYITDLKNRLNNG